MGCVSSAAGSAPDWQSRRRIELLETKVRFSLPICPKARSGFVGKWDSVANNVSGGAGAACVRSTIKNLCKHFCSRSKGQDVGWGSDARRTAKAVRLCAVLRDAFLFQIFRIFCGNLLYAIHDSNIPIDNSDCLFCSARVFCALFTYLNA